MIASLSGFSEIIKSFFCINVYTYSVVIHDS